MSTKATKLLTEGARLASAIVRYRASPVGLLRRYWALYRGRRFSPDEIHFFRLLDPALSPLELEQVVSKEELLEVQRRLNPPHLHHLTEDKLHFYDHCLAAELPVPRIFALWDPAGTARCSAIRVLANVADLDAFLETAPPELIFKPVAGVHGEGVTRVRREGAIWRDSHGAIVSGRALHALFVGSVYRTWMAQELIHGHEALVKLSGTDALQTVRVVTHVSDGDVEILAARLRLICGRGAHDNFDYGRSGNLIAILDTERGAIRSVVGGSQERLEIRHFTHHPVTGNDLRAFSLPDWASVRRLVHTAARAFLPLRTIGWDVALTPGEPCLIEGNVTWDTLSGDPRMGDIYRRLAALASGDSRQTAKTAIEG